MQVYELPNETKAATGFTHKAIVTHVDLTESTADTDQTIALLSVVAGDVVQKAAFQLVTAFSDASDAAFNDTQGPASATAATPTEYHRGSTAGQRERHRSSTSPPTSNTTFPSPTRRRTRLTSWLRA
jgi:hypothetical protein